MDEIAEPRGPVTNGEIFRAVIRLDKRMDGVASSMVYKDVYDIQQARLTDAIEANRTAIKEAVESWKEWRSNGRTVKMWLAGLSVGVLTSIAYETVYLLH